MMTELEVFEGAEKILRRRGYNWETYGWNATGSLCLGGAMGHALLKADQPISLMSPRELRALPDETTHPACARFLRIMPPVPGEMISENRESLRDVSRATKDRAELDVQAALSQAISECRAEEVAIAERELTAV